MNEKSSGSIIKALIHKLLVTPENCDYKMNSVLSLCKDMYQLDQQTNFGAVLYFLMQQFVFEDQPNFIEYAKKFACEDDIVLLEIMSNTIDKNKLTNIISSDHLKHYMTYINAASKVAMVDEELYELVYIPCYFVNHEIKYVHVRGEENAGLICTFVSLDHANGFSKDFETSYEHAIDFYKYNEAGNTPIAPHLKHFVIKPIMIKKEDLESIEIHQVAND